MITGQCLCGGVHYTVTGDLPECDGEAKVPMPVLCYCSMCRRQTGSAFTAIAMAKLPQLFIDKGEKLLKRYESSKGIFRSFCGECGSFLLAHYEDIAPDQVYLRWEQLMATC